MPIDPAKAWEMSQKLSDPYSVRILRATLGVPKDAITLSRELGIPIAVTYRRIKDLLQLGLLEEAGRKLTRKGKWITLYRSTVREFQIFMEDGKMKLRIVFRGDRKEEAELT